MTRGLFLSRDVNPSLERMTRELPCKTSNFPLISTSINQIIQLFLTLFLNIISRTLLSTDSNHLALLFDQSSCQVYDSFYLLLCACALPLPCHIYNYNPISCFTSECQLENGSSPLLKFEFIKKANKYHTIMIILPKLEHCSTGPLGCQPIGT